MPAIFLFMGGLSGFLSVALGAFAAHGLRKKLSEPMVTVFQTGAQYQMVHSLALLFTAVLLRLQPDAGVLVTAGWFFSAGILLFSGSLYALSITGIRKLGAITPLGGVSFLIGWAMLAYYGLTASF